MSRIKNNLYFKIGGIVLIALLLLIPTGMIKSIIYEREQTQREAIDEVSEKWGGAQTLQGPVLSIPYTRYVKEIDKATGKETLVQITERLHVLPSKLDIQASVKPDRRHRGVYEIVVYNSALHVSGAFTKLDFKDLEAKGHSFKFNEATLNAGIDDLRGIEKQIELNWEGKKLPFNPGVSNQDIFYSGINAKVNVSPTDDHLYRFSFDIELKGSQQLYFTPVGKETDVVLNSDWQTPKFDGAFLPDQHKTDKAGFKAHWNVLNLNRNYPQSWTGSSYKLRDSSFGVDLKLPVDNYQKSHRSIHYAILFIGLTFLVFFFIEIFQASGIHPIQYILVGIALVVFYTLLLSISEHIRFNYAFILSALATVALISLYVRAILRSLKMSLFIAGLLSMLYIFIFVIIQLEDLALLIGSIGVFIILGLVMYFSRKIDWYNIGQDKNAI
ncbi:MAG: cell envelope integrity protein CreD [Flavobacteriales bacterium]|jgi:inner membrane protein